MRYIYHIISRDAWETVGAASYSADSLATEGFIHCSNADQVAQVANLIYAEQPDLLVLCIDVDRLTSQVSDEDPGVGELFPHVYGPINREAVTGVVPLQRGAENRWEFSPPK